MPVEQTPISKSKKRDAESDTDFRVVSDEIWKADDDEDKTDDVQSRTARPLGIGEVASRSVPEAGPAAQPSRRQARRASSAPIAPIAPPQPKPSPRRPSSAKKAKPSGIVSKK